MIAHLRRRHRTMTLVLAVAAPLVFAAAMLSRPTLPADASLEALGNKLGTDAVLLGQYVVDVGAQPIEMALYGRPGDSSAQLVVEPGAPHTPSPPDILAYWQTQEPGARPASDAHLLGPWSPKRRNVFELPAGASRGGLVFYSLAHDEIVGRQWPVVVTP